MRQGRGKRGGRGKRRVQLGDDTERACANPNVDYARLLNGTDHRHTCERVRRACLFNGTIVSAEPGSADAAHAAAVSRRLRVRDMWESGQEHPLSDYHSLHHPTNPLGATLVADVARGGGFSACVPLVWLPAWLMNFGESLIASLLPIDELQEAHLIDGRVLLTPELWHCGMPSVPLSMRPACPCPQPPMRPPAALEARPRTRGHARIREKRPRRSDAKGTLRRRSVVVPCQGGLIQGRGAPRPPSPARRVWPPRRFPGDRFPIWKMIGKLADQTHPATRLRGLMERAGKCTDARARQVHTEHAPCTHHARTVHAPCM